MSNKSTVELDQGLEGMNLMMATYHARALEPMIKTLRTDEAAKNMQIWPNASLMSFFFEICSFNKTDKTLLNTNTVGRPNLASLILSCEMSGCWKSAALVECLSPAGLLLLVWQASRFGGRS